MNESKYLSQPRLRQPISTHKIFELPELLQSPTPIDFQSSTSTQIQFLIRRPFWNRDLFNSHFFVWARDSFFFSIRVLLALPEKEINFVFLASELGEENGREFGGKRTTFMFWRENGKKRGNELIWGRPCFPGCKIFEPK